MTIRNGRHSKYFSFVSTKQKPGDTVRGGSDPKCLDNLLSGGWVLPFLHSLLPRAPLSPHSQLRQGVPAHNRLGAPRAHSALPCIFRTPWPPLVRLYLQTLLLVISARLGMWGRGPLGTGALLNHTGAYSSAGGAERPFTKGNLEFPGYHAWARAGHLCSETVKRTEPAPRPSSEWP